MEEDLVTVLRRRSPGAKALRNARGLMSMAMGLLGVVGHGCMFESSNLGSHDKFGVVRRDNRSESR